MNLPIASMDQIQLFLLVFVRIVSMLALLPIFGSQNIPPQLKVGLAFMLTIILFPVTALHGQIAVPLSLGLFALMILKEVFVGILIGFTASFLFAAVQFAGRVIDTETGFAFAELVDPFSDMSVTVLGQLKILVFTLFFLLINGHYFMLIAIQKSFEVIPLCGVHLPSGRLSFLFTSMVGEIFVSALKLSAPVFITLFMTSLAMGVIARTVPQINVFFVGMPLKIVVGMGAMVIVFPTLAVVFRGMFEALIRDMWRLLYLMA